MHYLLPYNNSKSNRTFLEYEGIPVLEMTRVFTRYYSHRGRLEYKEEISNQKPCKKNICEAWYRLAPNVLEELLQSKAKENCRMTNCRSDISH